MLLPPLILVETRRKAEEGDKEAKALLGLLNKLLYPNPGDSAEIRLFRFMRAAELGSPTGMLLVGDALSAGLGAARNDALALEWYRKGAAADYRVCHWAVGVMAWEGREMDQDNAAAWNWFQKAVVPQEFGGTSNIKLAAFMLGLMTENGQSPVENTAPERAEDYYQRSAEAGYYLAKIRCSQLHALGADVREFSGRTEQLTCGVMAGRPEDLYVMGHACLQGHGLPQSDIDALVWFTLAHACASALPRAAEICGTLRDKLSPEELSAADAQIAELSQHEARCAKVRAIFDIESSFECGGRYFPPAHRSIKI